MKTLQLARRATWAGALALGLSAVAWASPTGNYQFSGVNFPDTYGPVTLAFDGVAEDAGGMSVDERVNAFAGIPGGITTNFGPLVSYEAAGDVVEWSFSTLDGQSFSDNIAAPWGFSIQNLQWPGTPPVATVGQTSYLYLTQNGVPLQINPAVATFLEVVVGPHPFDPAIPQVIYITGQDPEVFADGNASIELSIEDTEDFPAALLQQLFATNPINDVHAGIMFQVIPEPTSVVLAGAAVAGLAMLVRRRR